VSFDGPGGDEQVLGDVTVGPAVGGELGDAALAGGQRVEPAEDEPPWPPAGGDQFGAGPLGQRQRAAAVGEVERGPEDLAAFCPVSGPPEECPKVGHSAGVLQPRTGALEHAYRLAQQLGAALSALGEAGRAQGNPERAGAVVGPGQRDLLSCERPRFR